MPFLGIQDILVDPPFKNAGNAPGPTPLTHYMWSSQVQLICLVFLVSIYEVGAYINKDYDDPYFSV